MIDNFLIKSHTKSNLLWYVIFQRGSFDNIPFYQGHLYQFSIMNALHLLLIFLCLQSSLALKCMTCGTDGICQPGVDEVSKECQETSKSCMINIVKVGNKTYDNKDCFEGPNGLNEAMRGCIHFS